MNKVLSVIITGIIILVLVYVIRHYLNKDYNLNGAKRWLTTSKYGRIVSMTSCLLFVIIILLLGNVTDKIVQYYHLPNWADILLEWVAAPILSFVVVAALFVQARADYHARKILGIKDDENDV
ncbi:MAG: hypothetical protein LBS01_08275 [Prevotellaceae bacterium]|jgi:cell division protein FtsW (lipid II flippase)|nr:hypothetical protein [Prevotellaceae bacterium]